MLGAAFLRHVDAFVILFRKVVLDVVEQRLVIQLRLGFGLFRHQACLQLAREVADLVVAPCAGCGIVRVAQPQAHLQQWCGNMPAQAHAQRQGQGQQYQAENAHALQTDGHRLLELAHVQADAQLPGHHFLKGDGGGIQALGLAQHAARRARAGFGEDATVHAVDGGMGHQRVLRQVAEQHVETEDVVGHQQFGGRGRRLGDQRLAQGIGLLLHGLLELHAHDPGIDDHRQRHQQQAVASDAQHQGHPPLTQRVEDHDEEVVGFDGRGPVHRARLLSTEVAAQYSERPGAGKAHGCPDRRETG